MAFVVTVLSQTFRGVFQSKKNNWKSINV